MVLFLRCLSFRRLRELVLYDPQQSCVWVAVDSSIVEESLPFTDTCSWEIWFRADSETDNWQDSVSSLAFGVLCGSPDILTGLSEFPEFVFDLSTTYVNYNWYVINNLMNIMCDISRFTFVEEEQSLMCPGLDEKSSSGDCTTVISHDREECEWLSELKCWSSSSVVYSPLASQLSPMNSSFYKEKKSYFHVVSFINRQILNNNLYYFGINVFVSEVSFLHTTARQPKFFGMFAFGNWPIDIFDQSFDFIRIGSFGQRYGHFWFFHFLRRGVCTVSPFFFRRFRCFYFDLLGLLLLGFLFRIRI